MLCLETFYQCLSRLLKLYQEFVILLKSIGESALALLTCKSDEVFQP